MRRVLITAAVLAAACTQNQAAAPVPPPEAKTPVDLIVIQADEATTTTVETIPVTTTTTEPEPTTTSAVPRPQPARNLQPVATTAVARPTSSQLASIRACEQNTNPNSGPTGYASDTGNGYYGAYQFSWGTWASVGGSGNPAHASPSEQDMRAQMMIDAGRRGEWPNC